MKKKVIGLRGRSNVGKSQTIMKAYDLLRSQHKTMMEEHQILGADIKVVLTINGVKIGIESRGDPNSRLKESLDLFVKEKCAVIVCATRTRGQTVAAVEDLHPNYEVFWLEQEVKPSGPQQQDSNNAMARRIVDEVKKIIG